MVKKIIPQGERLADKAIYLHEDRYEGPKEIFKFIAGMLDGKLSTTGKMLDVGCATGELIFFLKKKFPGFSFTGIDVSESLIQRAKEKIPSEKFVCSDILTKPFKSREKFDVVFCIGVLSILDEIDVPLKNLLSCVKGDGTLIVAGMFNDEPIDILMRYKPAAEESSKWLTGWNTFSTYSYERILKSMPYDLELEWSGFRMPYQIKKGPDPMRSWTIKTGENPFQQVNGACQLVNIKVLRVRVKRKLRP